MGARGTPPVLDRLVPSRGAATAREGAAAQGADPHRGARVPARLAVRRRTPGTVGAAIVLAAAALIATSCSVPVAQPRSVDPSGPSDAPPPSALASLPPPSPLPLSSPLPLPSPTLPPLGLGVVPILYLHRVEAPPPAWPTWTDAQRKNFLAYDDIPAAFAAQLDWLAAHDYTTILPSDLAANWDDGTPLPPRPVIITLDDGWPSWVETVLPLLQAHHMVAEFYLTLDAIARNAITWGEVRTLAAAGMGIGAHDVHHVQLAGLPPPATPAPSPVMWWEVSQARTIIGREVGALPDSMAYVGGGLDPELESLVHLAGYTTARSTIRGVDQSIDRRDALRVVGIGGLDDVVDQYTGQLVPGLPTFAAKVAGTLL